TVSITVTAIKLTGKMSGPQQVQLTWTGGATDVSGYTLQRSNIPIFAFGATTFTIPANATTFTDTTVAARTIYFYRISATNASGSSAFSNVTFVLVLGNANGLVLALNFNETSGTIANDSSSSGNGNNATISGALHVPGRYGNG